MKSAVRAKLIPHANLQGMLDCCSYPGLQHLIQYE